MSRIEHALERGLFLSRWLMAPMYAGLAGSLFLLLWVFVQEIWHLFAHVTELTTNDAILGVLALIDLSLAANLVLIVIFSGYENFVSKFNDQTHEDRPDWQGTVDFAGLKLKLIASIVAISGIHLLKVFMDIGKTTPEQIRLMLIIHVVFVVSGLLLAAMDWVTVQAKVGKSK